MDRIYQLLTATALLASTAAYAEPALTAEQQESAQAALEAKSANDPKVVVCRSIVATGSRLGASKTCMTRQQWADVARLSGDYTAQRQIQSLRNGPVGGP